MHAMSPTKPVESITELVDIFRNWEKKPASRLIGLEQENFVVRSNLKPVSYAEKNGVRAVLEAIFDCKLERLFPNAALSYEGGSPIALSSDAGSITLEPGGQLELSAAPHDNLFDSQQEFSQFDEVLELVGKKLGVRFLRVGLHPTASLQSVSLVPKLRYHIMAPIMERAGSRGLDMMKRSTTVQANLDYTSETEMVRFFRLGLRMSPVVNGLFASSPFLEGKATGRLSERAEVWAHTDPDRCGFPEVVFEEGFGYEKWVKWVSGVPMYFINREDRYIAANGLTFKKFMESGLEGNVATLSDFMIHLSTIFTEVRLKPHLEMRSADGGGSGMALALGALWKGALYNEESLKALEKIIPEYSSVDLKKNMEKVSKFGLSAELEGGSASFFADKILQASKQGLKEIGLGEELFLKPLFQILESKETHAEAMLKRNLKRGDKPLDFSPWMLK